MYEAVIMAGNCVVCGEYSLVTNVLQGDRGFLDKIGRGCYIFEKHFYGKNKRKTKCQPIIYEVDSRLNAWKDVPKLQWYGEKPWLIS